MIAIVSYCLKALTLPSICCRNLFLVYFLCYSYSFGVSIRCFPVRSQQIKHGKHHPADWNNQNQTLVWLGTLSPFLCTDPFNKHVSGARHVWQQRQTRMAFQKDDYTWSLTLGWHKTARTWKSLFSRTRNSKWWSDDLSWHSHFIENLVARDVSRDHFLDYFFLCSALFCKSWWWSCYRTVSILFNELRFKWWMQSIELRCHARHACQAFTECFSDVSHTIQSQMQKSQIPGETVRLSHFHSEVLKGLSLTSQL